MGKRTKKRQKRQKNKATKNVESLAREFAKIMNKMPRREHQGAVFINHLGDIG
jgi:hypothetical protein